jgi:signal transduction histidine kinase
MNDLFEFANLAEGNTAFNIQEINICNALRDALSESYNELESGGFTMDVDIPDAPEICFCDEGALRRVFQNLFKNVIDHGKDHLRVRIKGGIIEIANKADGLAELDTGSIFERFYTSDASRTSKNTGLGLAIARELVSRMDGRITARAEEDMLVMRLELKKP